jgi:hypothetical protein
MGNAEIEAVVKDMTLLPEQHMRERFLIKMNRDDIQTGRNKLKVGVYSDGKLITTAKTTFVGPLF